jgi:hypothetical protein
MHRFVFDVGTATVAIALWLGAGSPARAQPVSVRGYTTPDPVNPDRFGLALPDGRYMVQLEEPCDVAIGQNVWVDRGDDAEWRLQPLESPGPWCGLFVFGRMSDVSCELGADGQCDVAKDPPVPEGY